MSIFDSLRADTLKPSISTWHATPLHKAAYENNTVGLLELITPENINFRDPLGWTALHVAVFLERVDVLRLLIDSGANIFATTRLGHTALHFACFRGLAGVVRSFIRATCDAPSSIHHQRPLASGGGSNETDCQDINNSKKNKRQRNS